MARLDAYSKGMRQKILIAAALLHNPDIILLDEPLSGLDVNAAILIKDLLAALAADGKTILYSSHVLDVVERICDRVLIIHQGALIADGSSDSLKASTHESTLEDVFRNLTHSGRRRYRRLPHRRGAALMNAILEACAAGCADPRSRALLRRFGIDPHRYWLLIDLFGELTDRREMLGHLGRDGISLKTAAVMYAVLAALISLIQVLSRRHRTNLLRHLSRPHRRSCC